MPGQQADGHELWLHLRVRQPSTSLAVIDNEGRPAHAALLALFHRISLGDPVVGEILIDFEHSEALEAKGVKRAVRRTNVRALHPRAAAAIEHHFLVTRSTMCPASQILNSLGLASRPEIQSARHMRAVVEKLLPDDTTAGRREPGAASSWASSPGVITSSCDQGSRLCAACDFVLGVWETSPPTMIAAATAARNIGRRLEGFMASSSHRKTARVKTIVPRLQAEA